MPRVFNFGAGPTTLPDEVLEQVRAELTDFRGTGMSVMEMAHRHEDFRRIAEKAEADLRELMAIPSNYKILFLHGGAQTQFAVSPLNLLGDKNKADYVNCIDESGGFYHNPVDPARRSWMNLPFTVADGGLDDVFLQEARTTGWV